MGAHPTATRLVDAAAALIDEHGPEALTVRAVLEASGASMGSLYHHHGSFDALLVAVKDRAMASWSEAFLGALTRRGLAAAYAADRAWGRRHPGLARLVADSGRRGGLGAAAVEFGVGLRAWLDSEALAVGAPAHLVAALVLGPASELRRLDGAVGRSPSAADLDALAVAVEAWLRSLTAQEPTRSRASSLRRR